VDLTDKMFDMPKIEYTVMGEYASTGIWKFDPFKEYSGEASYESLGLSSELIAEFKSWIDIYEKRLHEKINWEEFNHKGRRLSRRLKNELPDDCELYFQPEDEAGSLELEEFV
jgi:hypothetical protein